MKHIKKLASLVLAVVMILALATTAFAATTVDNKTDHPYKAYQIFSGTQASGSSELGDIEWGSGVNGETLLTALKADDRFKVGGTNIFANAENANDVAKVLANYSDSSAVAKAFANVADNNKKGDGTEIAANASSVDLAAGYYLIVDASDNITGNDAYNSALLQITGKGDLTIEEKYDVPTFDKDIIDNGINVEAADYNIGDTVIYELRGTLPKNYSDYESYKYIFHDTLSKGQAFQNDVKVYVDSVDTTNEITSDKYTVTPTAAQSGSDQTDITISFENLKTIANITASNAIIVRYTAKLTSDAKIGKDGNPNTAYLEFSNNPNKDGSGNTGSTPEDKTLVFTYELDVTKVDGTNTDTKLKDAQFTLKAIGGEHAGKYVTLNSDGTVKGWLDNQPSVAADSTSVADAAAAGVLITAETTGLVNIKGLDAGTYELEEIKAPAGYNKLSDPITVTITASITGSANADHDKVDPALTALTIKVGDKTAEDGNLNNGIVSTQIENNKGTSLPETGGIGTTIFYVTGAVLALGAGILLITKRRMNR